MKIRPLYVQLVAAEVISSRLGRPSRKRKILPKRKDSSARAPSVS